jgi:hypothetical protein
MLNGTTKMSLLYSISLPWQNIKQLLVIDCWFGDYFSLIFVSQDMQESPFPFYEEFVVACAYMQNAKFVTHIY